jgi:Mg-chelatase subunit ChlD
MPDGDRLRSEEFINAFDYRDPAPAPGQRVGFHWERARNPFAHNRELLRFSVQTAAAGREPGQPLNLVLLLDNSGSMERADRVAITEQMMKVLAAQLTGYDRISVITFARTPRLIVDGMRGDVADAPEALLEQVIGLNPDGGTNLEAALGLAYETATKHFLTHGNNRVIVITDGAANLGNLDPEQLRERVIEQRKKGIALDCFGVGWEGYNDNLLESLSRNGDGRYGFLNDAERAPFQFAGQLAGALQVAAADVKAQVEFNPNRVTVYRQIGYQQHQLTKEQFRDNTVDAAEIGAAEAGNALYSVEINPSGNGPIGTFRVRYRVPSTGQYEEKEWVLPYAPDSPDLESAPAAMRLAATSAAFAEWLAGSPYAQTVSTAVLQNLLRNVPETYSPDPRPAQLQSMIQQAQAISGR